MNLYIGIVVPDSVLFIVQCSLVNGFSIFILGKIRRVLCVSEGREWITAAGATPGAKSQEIWIFSCHGIKRLIE